MFESQAEPPLLQGAQSICTVKKATAHEKWGGKASHAVKGTRKLQRGRRTTGNTSSTGNTTAPVVLGLHPALAGA
jgi:hypothetical protein